jgi:hypothetical protein
MNLSKKVLIGGLFSVILLNACGQTDNSSLSSNSSSSKYRLWCLANLNFAGNSRTVRAEGTKLYKQDKLKLVDTRKEKEEYTQTLIKLQTLCNGLYTVMNVSGCSNIKFDNPKILTESQNVPGSSVRIPFSYTGTYNNAVTKYQGEYYCEMRLPSTP